MTGTDWALVGNVGALLAVAQVGWTIVRTVTRVELKVEMMWNYYIDQRGERGHADDDPRAAAS